MIGQRLWVGIPETTISEETRQHLLTVNPGGVILFGRNVESRDQVSQLIDDLRSILGPSLLVSIDQEGGRVVRIPRGVSLFPGNLALGAAARRNHQRALELAQLQGQISGMELRDLGIDVNLAPCVDLLRSSTERGIGSRSFGSDPALASALAERIGSGHRAQGVRDCWKHFPGIGRATVDPHFGLPRISADDGEVHVAPFRVAATSGASMIMTSHVIADGLDAENPVTISWKAVTGHLRQEIGFSGVIISDCLEMGGVSGFDFETVIAGAARAGHDALLVSHTPELQLLARQTLEQLQSSDPSFERTHQESIRRLTALTMSNEIETRQLPSGSEVAEEIARNGTTLLSGPRAIIEEGEKWLLVLSDLESRSPVEDPLRGEDLSHLIERLGESVECFKIGSAPDRAIIERVVARGSEAAGVIMALQGFRHSSEVTELVQAVAEADLRLIMVLLEDPRDLVAAPSGDRVSVISSFGFRPVHQAAIASALLGEFEPSDRSPVEFF
ncbi:MAG: glycoside hydrolase family 3 N-terminal domain-containing protein [Planctomycetota bacterium]|nr:glycoside hydrolase family 3 N-terminal domain-containing protein [Planctomycetota bacterium]